jgi:hypothetical protein
MYVETFQNSEILSSLKGSQKLTIGTTISKMKKKMLKVEMAMLTAVEIMLWDLEPRIIRRFHEVLPKKILINLAGS